MIAKFVRWLHCLAGECKPLERKDLVMCSCQFVFSSEVKNG